MTHPRPRPEGPRRRFRRWLPAVLAAMSLTLLPPVGSPARAAGLLIADGGFGGQLEIEEHAVEVTINNGIAVTTVTQVFRNLEDRQVEALYTFPVPKAASVANFSMWIDGREMIGEVVEKQRAREIYNSYKRVRRDPGLLEQNDYKTFEMRIFPIAPRAEQQVRLTYYQELDFDDDWATYVYPLATATREAIDTSIRGRFALTVDVVSEVPIAEIASPSHVDDFATVRHAEHYAQASLETSGGDLGRDVVLAYRLSRPQTGVDVIGSMERGEDGFFMVTLTAGEELDDPDAAGMDYIFVLDVSGSMNHDGKLALSRNAAQAFTEALGEEDRFELLTFNVAADSLFRELRGADEASKRQAGEFLEAQRARGGTVLEPAIRAAYRYKDPDRPLNVVILSDGMTEQAERQVLIRLIGERPANTRVFAIGVGNEVNRPLLQQLAEDAGGLAAFVSRGDDFDRQAEAFRRKLMRPVLSNLRLETAGGELYDLEPARLPDLYHGAPVRLYGRYAKPGTVALTLRGTIGGEPFDRRVELSFPDESATNPEIERMWAWHRIQRLLRDADRQGSREGVIDEIVRLGEAFSIVTEYTSFLVLENDAEYRRWKIERRNALRIERDRAAREEVQQKLASLRRDAQQLGPLTADASKSRQVRPNSPSPIPVPQAPARTPAPTTTSPTSSSRGFDLDLGGGGAFDPFTLSLVAGLAGLSASALRGRGRKRRDR